VLEFEHKSHLIYKHAVSTISRKVRSLRRSFRRGRRAIMNATVPFVKMNGTRNEFVVVDGRETPLDDPVAFAQHICDPTRARCRRSFARARLGTADVRMRIINADGSEPEMCATAFAVSRAISTNTMAAAPRSSRRSPDRSRRASFRASRTSSPK